MITLPASVKIYLCLAATDMRRGFDALSRMAAEVTGEDPLSGHLFVFRGRRGDRMKILYWDRDGMALWHKRLERGTFRFPPAGASASAEASPAELAMILEGVDFSSARRRPRYTAKSADADAKNNSGENKQHHSSPV